MYLTYANIRMMKLTLYELSISLQDDQPYPNYFHPLHSLSILDILLMIMHCVLLIQHLEQEFQHDMYHVDGRFVVVEDVEGMHRRS